MKKIIKRPDLINGPIKTTIIKMALGMIVGLFAMAAFNAVDTFFVGKLGVEELAAMSYTFPVVMVLNSLSLGLGVGMSSTVSRALGEKNMAKVRNLTSTGLLLCIIIVIILGITGILLIDPIFTVLGATGRTLELIHKYMVIWYIGLPFVVIPMAGNNVIRATGDTKTASNIMLASVFINVILDPLFIFGIGPFPEMGIQGAAIATVIARFSTLILSLSILTFREKLLVFKLYSLKEVTESWKSISFVGIPAALVQAANPLTLGIITRLLASYGDTVVAGYGTASKVEMIVLMIPAALSTAMSPFSGQNWGAKNFDRIKKGLNFTAITSLIWGAFVFVLFMFFTEPIIAIFNKDINIIKAGSNYLKIISLSYGCLGILNICSQSLSAINKPLESTIVNVIKSIVINIPLAFIGAHFFYERGVFTATFVTNIIGGIIAFVNNNIYNKQG